MPVADEIDVHGYPDAGVRSADDFERREAIDEQLAEVLQLADEVEQRYEKVLRVEDAYQDA